MGIGEEVLLLEICWEWAVPLPEPPTGFWVEGSLSGPRTPEPREGRTGKFDLRVMREGPPVVIRVSHALGVGSTLDVWSRNPKY